MRKPGWRVMFDLTAGCLSISALCRAGLQAEPVNGRGKPPEGRQEPLNGGETPLRNKQKPPNSRKTPPNGRKKPPSGGQTNRRLLWLIHKILSLQGTLNLTGYVTAKTAAGTWTHIPPEKVTALTGNTTAWHNAFEKTLGPHTSVDTKAKNEARKATEGFVRPFVAQFLKFDPVTNEDRTAMNLHNRDTTHTPIGVPATRALITDIKALGDFRAEIRFQDEATPNSKAIPYGDNGRLLNYTVGTEKITDYAVLTQSKLMTRSPWTMTFVPEAEGKFLSCSTRWQNERGELGPLGEIQSIVIA